ncbi:MAG: hypothetical protein HXX15_02530 [Rhodopseudomonas sp.]|uniref:hypothetical protein n=1 Tax=Rhodopseudomonas sp. TaxID=1078 RepID=UPI0018308E33|nr:hypothetical protein [Rhodopseudomonas sp.]NVN84941.1 hypothetical protein [Rhodopseudomonas sp.]
MLTPTDGNSRPFATTAGQILMRQALCGPEIGESRDAEAASSTVLQMKGGRRSEGASARRIDPLNFVVGRHSGASSSQSASTLKPGRELADITKSEFERIRPAPTRAPVIEIL